jgi:2-methylcitrate dehydratase PrpD
MVQPYIDCALRLRSQGIAPDDIAEMICEVGEGTVHRLWEPLAEKQRPPNGYSAKFATPYCIAAAFLSGSLGLDAFTDAATADPAARALAAKVRYRIDPANPYPAAFTGHIRATLRDGRALEERQPHMRGGANEPLTRAELEDKFARNARTGGWTEDRLAAALTLARTMFDGAVDLTALRG